MSEFKENITIHTQSAIVTIQEVALVIRNAFKAMPAVKQTIVLFLLITIIPAYIGVRYGSEKVFAAQYARQAVSAHPSYTVTLPPIVGTIKLLRNTNGIYSAYTEVSNPNLELSANNIPYTVNFINKAGESIYSVNNTLYLLPNEKKYIVIPRVEAGDALTTGTIELGDVDWQKRLSIPQVELRVSEPILSEEYNPLTFAVEGSVVNNSPYAVQAVRLVFFLYDGTNNIIGVSQRDEFRLPAFGRRAYKQLWPGLYKADIKKVQVEAYTNTMDAQNITVENSGAPTVADPRSRKTF